MSGNGAPVRLAARIANGLAALALCAPVASADTPHAVTAFGGILLDNAWEDLFVAPQDLRFEGSYLAGAAASTRLAQPMAGLAVELEGQLVRHFGDQTHWEVNAPIVTARWSRFPWSDALYTSAAFGLGLSWASEEPTLEVENEGASEQLMAYWMIEVETATPVENWSLVGRLHHRSTAYGLFGDDGGANALALGLRRRF